MKIKLSEKGQALAEYAPLIPPILLLSVVILIPLAENASNIFCQMVNAFDPAACQPVEEEEEELVQEDDTCETVPFEQGASYCSQHDDCAELPGVNEGTYWSSGTIETFIIKAGQGYHLYESGVTDDGCYYVSIAANSVEWERIGSGPNCKDISHTQVWNVPVCQASGGGDEPPVVEVTPTEEVPLTEEATPSEEATPTEEACTTVDTSEGATDCNQSDDCTRLPGVDDGFYNHDADVEAIIIKAGRDYRLYESGVTDDGCLLVEINGNHIEWTRIGSGSDCKKVKHVQVWEVPVCISE
jgi:hypothetical protein